MKRRLLDLKSNDRLIFLFTLISISETIDIKVNTLFFNSYSFNF